tara:strand:+ start:158 stop:676 length:519 start_codon:yes stop_codon:yes gene_type:complete
MQLHQVLADLTTTANFYTTRVERIHTLEHEALLQSFLLEHRPSPADLRIGLHGTFPALALDIVANGFDRARELRPGLGLGVPFTIDVRHAVRDSDRTRQPDEPREIIVAAVVCGESASAEAGWMDFGVTARGTPILTRWSEDGCDFVVGKAAQAMPLYRVTGLTGLKKLCEV